MLAGEAGFHVGEEVDHLKPGGLLVIPPDVIHYSR